MGAPDDEDSLGDGGDVDGAAVAAGADTGAGAGAGGGDGADRRGAGRARPCLRGCLAPTLLVGWDWTNNSIAARSRRARARVTGGMSK